MPLSHNQKNYLKKNIRKEGLNAVAEKLNTDPKDILEYLRKRWSREKVDAFLERPSANPPHGREISKKWFQNNWLSFLLLFILVLVTYANSANNTFVSDDIAEIAQKREISQFSYIFTHPFGFIRLILYWLIFQLGDLNPFGFRLINFFFHSGNVFLIFILFNLLYSSRKLAFVVAAIFAVHPAISEAVVWISGGSYPQYSFFFLISFILYILSKSRGLKYYWASVLIFSFALMSHPQMPLPLFFIFPLYEFAFGSLRKNWFKVFPFLGISLAYVFINIGALPERTTTLQSVHYQEKGVDNLFVLLPIAISSYFELIFFPKTLTLYHSELAFGTFQFIVRSLVTIIFIASIFLFLKKNKSLFFWLSFFLLSLSPTLTPFRLNWIVAERYIYLPSLGIFAAVGLGLIKLSKLKQFKWVSLSLFILVLILLSARTIMRNIDWKNEDNLWIATGKTSPSSPNTHNNLGDVYGRWGDKQKALQEFQTAILLKPNYADAYHNLANTYVELQQLDLALENYQKAISFNPNLWQSNQNIASIYYQQKNYDKALEYIQKALAINPKNINLWNNLGIVYLIMGNNEKAREVFNQVLSLDPQRQLSSQDLVELSK